MTNFVVAGTQFVRNLLILQENIIGGRSASPQGAAFVLKRELVGNRLRSRCTVGTTPLLDAGGSTSVNRRYASFWTHPGFGTLTCNALSVTLNFRGIAQ